MDNFSDVAQLIVDGNRGIYIAQDWARYVVSNDMHTKGINKSDFKILLSGPDNEEYFEIWDYVVDSVFVQDAEGIEYRIYQNSDLWMYPEGADIDWSKVTD